MSLAFLPKKIRPYKWPLRSVACPPFGLRIWQLQLHVWKDFLSPPSSLAESFHLGNQKTPILWSKSAEMSWVCCWHAHWSRPLENGRVFRVSADHPFPKQLLSGRKRNGTEREIDRTFSTMLFQYLPAHHSNGRKTWCQSYQTFSSSLALRRNKLGRVSVAEVFTLAYCFRIEWITVRWSTRAGSSITRTY